MKNCLQTCGKDSAAYDAFRVKRLSEMEGAALVRETARNTAAAAAAAAAGGGGGHK